MISFILAIIFIRTLSNFIYDVFQILQALSNQAKHNKKFYSSMTLSVTTSTSSHKSHYCSFCLSAKWCVIYYWEIVCVLM